jgi:2,4-diaminopentanoate dehydrogenase
MPSPIRILQYGLGPIGQSCASVILDKEETGHVKLVGAIDIDPDKSSKTVGEIIDRQVDPSVRVWSSLADFLEDGNEADLVLHTTSSFLERVVDQLDECVRAGLHVVSSTEELSYPLDRWPDLSSRIDEAAKAGGVAVLGTGVNPGYVMDTLALVATGVCTEVRSVRIDRIVDAGRRRIPLQMKVGAGMSVEEFEARKEAGGFGHIGLVESAQMVAAGLGWELVSLDETLEADVAKSTVTSTYRTVEAGSVAGIVHSVEARAADGRTIQLRLNMAVGAYPPSDTIEIEGTPPLRLTIPGGVFGDTATVAMLVNSIPRVFEAEPGLHTMLTLAVPRAFATAAGEVDVAS